MLVRSGNPLELLEAKRYDQFKKFLAGDGKNVDLDGRILISPEIDENIVISAAMYSSQIGDDTALKIFGDMSFNFDTCDQFGFTPLIYAARHDHPQCIKLILDKKYGATIDFMDRYHKTAAIHAAEMGNSNCLKILAEFGANLEATDVVGNSVSYYAFENGHMDCITVLSQFKVVYLFLFFFSFLFLSDWRVD